MKEPNTILSLATLLAFIGLYLLLPRGGARGRGAGAILALVGFGGWASQLPGFGDWLSSGFFMVVAGVTVISAVATVTFRSPVYCAIWFGLMLAGTAGLFLLAGAEFLAVATVVVYAGAILVTFLFVLMLSEPEGHTSYDRRSWEALLSSATGAVLIGILSMTFAKLVTSPTVADTSTGMAAKENAAVGLAWQGLPRLGAELFSRHLVAVEAAGILLFAALVGAAIIVAQGHSRRA